MIWDKLSAFYDFFETVYNGKCFMGIAEKIKEYINSDDTVLECACGTGLLSVPMASICKKLVATDFSEGMLWQCAKKTKGLANIIIERQNILDLPYQDNSFDVVVAANVIHLLDNPACALSQMKRVCKPDGKIIIPTYINKENKNSMLAAKLLGKTVVDFKRQFSLETYKEFFRRLGIKDAEYKIVDGRMPCCFASFVNIK